MILYHFTSPERLAKILVSGMLKTTESNIGSPRTDWPPAGEHFGPDVVWLTDRELPDATALALFTTDGTDKTAVRITVDVPDCDVDWWPDFAKEYGINRNWRRALERGRDPESWWVVSRPIRTSEIVDLEDRPTIRAQRCMAHHR